MAIDKAVDSTQLDADLTSVADAIRDKAGIGSLVKLSFPEEFVQNIESIPLPTGEWVITLTRNSQTGAWEPDRNFTEVYDAYAAGKTVAIRVAPSEAQYCSAGAFFHSSGYFQSSYLDYWVYEWKSDPVTLGQYVSYKLYEFRWNGITPSPEELIYYTTDADADPSEVVSGAIFYNASGKQTGTYIPVDVIPLSAAQNGVYSAPSGKAYSPVTVSVPNSYSAADEGKVVHNGALTPQTSSSVTSNGTVDTTLISSLTVDVSGGGGGTEAEDGIITKTISGAYENSRVTKIGSYTFYYCASLTTASFPACTTIDACAFSSCTSLSAISFPVCKTIGTYAFTYCTKLTAASFPACTSIGASAFYNCTSLTTVSFPACTFIGTSAFTYCTKLTAASFPACTTIGSGAFYSCFSLSTASFPACTTIRNSAFRSCTRLISLYLMGSSVATLGTSAFASTPIGGYSATAGQYGSVFVPQSLLASYQAATNWASIASRIVGV
ncbi:MAG: leucine-rich repeat domain-containing protein [Clostridia bacterium]|nr:leucine-rich repeat domain-containing protein [Clostridia bacterium]